MYVNKCGVSHEGCLAAVDINLPMVIRLTSCALKCVCVCVSAACLCACYSALGLPTGHLCTYMVLQSLGCHWLPGQGFAGCIVISCGHAPPESHTAS